MFRVDRLREPRLVTSHFEPREIPSGLVGSSLGSTPRHRSAKLAIPAMFSELEGVLRWIDHTPLEISAGSCVVEIRSEDLGRLTMAVARIALTATVKVIEPDELADSVRQFADHLKVSSL